MKRALLFAAAVAAFPLTAAPAAGVRQRIAVLDLRAVQGVSPGTATILTAIVVDDTARGGYDVISQADISAMLGFEKQKQVLGCAEDSSCLAEIGGALGVEFVLSGQVGQIGSRFHLSLQLLDARKSKVVSRVARFSDRDEDRLAEAAQRSLGELLEAARAASQQRVATRTDTPAKAPASNPEPPPPAKLASPGPDLAARPALPQPASPAERSSGFHPSRRTAWLTMGGGAALMLGGVVFGLQAASKKSDLENAWADPNYPALYDSKSKEVKSAALLSNVFWGAGIATSGAGAWMFFRSRERFAVAPVAADGQLGLVAAGSF